MDIVAELSKLGFKQTRGGFITELIEGKQPLHISVGDVTTDDIEVLASFVTAVRRTISEVTSKYPNIEFSIGYGGGGGMLPLPGVSDYNIHYIPPTLTQGSTHVALPASPQSLKRFYKRISALETDRSREISGLSTPSVTVNAGPSSGGMKVGITIESNHFTPKYPSFAFTAPEKEFDAVKSSIQSIVAAFTSLDQLTKDYVSDRIKKRYKLDESEPDDPELVNILEDLAK